MNITLLNKITAGLSESDELLKEAEAAATAAKQSYELVAADDGTLDPEELLSLRAEASKKKEIAQIALDRAKIAKANAEREVAEVLVDHCQQVRLLLLDKAAAIEAGIIEGIIKLIGVDGSDHYFKDAVEKLIRICPEIRSRRASADTMSALTGSQRSSKPEVFISHLAVAVKLI